MTDNKKVKLSLKNNPAKPWTGAGNKPDDASIIIAEVSVADGVDGTSYMAKLQFSGANQDDVYFLDGTGEITSLKTESLTLTGSQASEVKFTAKKALQADIVGGLYAGEVMVPNSSDTATFTFEVQLDKISLDVSPKDIFFGDKISATVKVTAGGVGVSKQPVTLDLDKTGPAVFVEDITKYLTSENGHSVFGGADDKGVFTVEIKADKWGGDFVSATIEDGSGKQLDSDKKNFTINPPKDLYVDLVILSNANNDGESVACGEFDKDGNYSYSGHAAADGESVITIYGYLGKKSDTTSGFGGEYVDIEIFGDAVFDPKSFDDPTNNKFSDKSGKKVQLMTMSSGKTQTLTIRSKNIITGNIAISGTVLDVSAVTPFEFFDPWTDVSSVHATFISSPVNNRRLLFANGSHYAGLQVLVQPKSPRVNLSISPDRIRGYIGLIDNITKEYLGRGHLAQWRASATPPNNSYGAAVFDTGQEILEEGRPSEADTSPAINYYITSTAYAGEKDESNSYTFGLEITPPGKTIKRSYPATKDRLGNYLGEVGPVAPITYCTNGTQPLDLSMCPSIRTLEKRTLTGDDLKVDAFFDKKDINDFGPVNKDAIDTADNFYRVWYFEAYIDNTKFDIPSDIATLSANTAINWPYSLRQVTKDLYSYQVYLWPFNVDPQYPSQYWPSPNEMTVEGEMDSPKTKLYHPEKAKIYFAWYANFSCFPEKSTPNKFISITGFDQYGNDLAFTFDTAGMPTNYKNSGKDVSEWNPFISGFNERAEQIQNRYNTSIDTESNKLLTPGVPFGAIAFGTYTLGIDIEYNGERTSQFLGAEKYSSSSSWSYLKSQTARPDPSQVAWTISANPNTFDSILNHKLYMTFFYDNVNNFIIPAKYSPNTSADAMWLTTSSLKGTTPYDNLSKCSLMLSPVWNTGNFVIFCTEGAGYIYAYAVDHGMSFKNFEEGSYNFEFYIT